MTFFRHYEMAMMRQLFSGVNSLLNEQQATIVSDVFKLMAMSRGN